MIIKSLELENYRNYRTLKIEPDPGINLFYGNNGQGKTNILEAVYLCATARSHRGNRDRELIHFGEEEAHIKLLLQKKGLPHRIDLHLKNGRKKGAAVDGLPIRKSTELFGILNVVLFSPEDLNIIKNAPAERRRFLDMELCQLDSVYTFNLVNYNKVLQQKNKLLKEAERYTEATSLLEVLNEQLLRYGIPVIERRSRFLEELGQLVSSVYEELSGHREILEIRYLPEATAEGIRAQLEAGSLRERKAGVSLTGPHRDDIGFMINGNDARKFGSQGQQRTAALSLKLAELQMVKLKTGDDPVLLLDDVLSELDSGRQDQLLRHISGIQTMMTATGMDEFAEHSFHIDKTFHIFEGSLTGGSIT